MKHIIYFPIFLCIVLIAISKESLAKGIEPKIAIQKINDKSASSRSGACDFGGIWSDPGDAISEILIDELNKLGGIILVERETISQIYENEFQQENLDQTTVSEAKKFIAANFVIAGSITEFEWCVSNKNQSIDIGALIGFDELSIQHKSSKAHVAIDLRLIDVKTGKIFKTFTSEGQINDSEFSTSIEAFGVHINKEIFDQTPLGKASRIAAKDAATKIHASIQKLGRP